MGSFRTATRRWWCKLRGAQFVHMLHIGKTGGTAVKAALQLAPARRNLSLRLHSHGTRLRDVPPGEKVFFFLRDPVARFVSGFYSRQRQGQPRYAIPWTPAEAVAFERFETPNALGLALASADSSLRSAAISAMNAITHVRSSYWDWFEDEAYFASRAGDVLMVGFQETLERDFDRLKSLLQLPSRIVLPADDTASHRSPRGLDRRLDVAAIEALQAWYARDYEFLELCRSLGFERCERRCA